MRCLVVTFVLASCATSATPGTERITAPVDPAAEPESAPVDVPAHEPTGTPPETPLAQTPPSEAPPAELWDCSTVLHPLVDFHRAHLELRADGTYELQHTHMTPEQGWSTWLQGTWARAENDDVVLVPERALRRAWIGDMHRQDHGEDVSAMQWEEAMTTAPWPLAHRTDPQLGEALAMPEVRTSVYRTTSRTPPPCDPGPPPRRHRQ